MRRREFLGAISAAAAVPFVASAQQAKIPVIGVLTFGNSEPSVSLLRESLRELGYVDGQTMQFVARNAEGNSSRLAEFAAELVRLKVEVIIGVQTPSVQAAKMATSDLTI